MELNALGRALMMRFMKLPVHLKVVLSGPPKVAIVLSKNVFVTPPPKHKTGKKQVPSVRGL